MQREQEPDYEADLSSSALADLNALPVWLRQIAEKHIIDQIAKDPVRASVKVKTVDGHAVGTYSMLQVGPIDGYLHHLTFIYRYSQDETRIEITSIGYMPERAPDSKDEEAF